MGQNIKRMLKKYGVPSAAWIHVDLDRGQLGVTVKTVTNIEVRPKSGGFPD